MKFTQEELQFLRKKSLSYSNHIAEWLMPPLDPRAIFSEYEIRHIQGEKNSLKFKAEQVINEVFNKLEIEVKE